MLMCSLGAFLLVTISTLLGWCVCVCVEYVNFSIPSCVYVLSGYELCVNTNMYIVHIRVWATA